MQIYVLSSSSSSSKAQMAGLSDYRSEQSKKNEHRSMCAFMFWLDLFLFDHINWSIIAKQSTKSPEKERNSHTNTQNRIQYTQYPRIRPYESFASSVDSIHNIFLPQFISYWLRISILFVKFIIK